MSQTIEIEVGSLYATLHEEFSQQVGEQYDEGVRQEVEEFLHRFNQEIERQVEEAEGAVDKEEMQSIET